MNRRNMIAALGLTLAVGISGALAFAQSDKKAESAKVGQAAPTWTGKDILGKDHSSSDFAGKILVIEWVNPQCPVCKGAHNDGRIPSMVKELRGMENVVFLAVNSTHNTNAEANAAALKDYGVEYPVILDTEGTIGHAFGARTTPHIFVIDTQGVLRYNGALDDDRTGNKTRDKEPVTNYVLNAVKQIQAGETVSPDTTQSYGCSVKYARGAKGPKNDDAGKGRMGSGGGSATE